MSVLSTLNFIDIINIDIVLGSGWLVRTIQDNTSNRRDVKNHKYQLETFTLRAF